MTLVYLRPLLWIATLAFGFVGSTFAQSGVDNFPVKTIRLIVPYAAGGGTDLVMRAIAPGMSEALGQAIVIENGRAKFFNDINVAIEVYTAIWEDHHIPEGSPLPPAHTSEGQH